MKVIFLDFDGVLNKCDNVNRIFYDITINLGKDEYKKGDFNLECLLEFKKLLNYLRKNDVKIVISSSWRVLFSLEEFNEFFNSFNEYELFSTIGINKDICIGKTPYGLEYKTRGDEILAYLKDNPSITNYVIIDDDIYDIKTHFDMSKIIWVDAKKGLTDNVVKDIINRLNRGSSQYDNI